MVWRGLEDYDSRIPSGSSRINTSSWGLSIHTNIKTRMGSFTLNENEPETEFFS